MARGIDMALRRMMVTIVASSLILSGCSGPTDHVESTVETVAVTEPIVEASPRATPAQFAFGDVVWSVCKDAEGVACVVRHIVVAQHEELVAVVPAYTADMEHLRRMLTDMAQAPLDDTGHLWLLLASNCYLDRSEAEVVAELENGGAPWQSLT